MFYYREEINNNNKLLTISRGSRWMIKAILWDRNRLIGTYAIKERNEEGKRSSGRKKGKKREMRERKEWRKRNGGRKRLIFTLRNLHISRDWLIRLYTENTTARYIKKERLKMYTLPQVRKNHAIQLKWATRKYMQGMIMCNGKRGWTNTFRGMHMKDLIVKMELWIY